MQKVNYDVFHFNHIEENNQSDSASSLKVKDSLWCFC